MLLLILIVLVIVSFRIPSTSGGAIGETDIKYPVYLDPPVMYLDQHIKYDEWPQE